MKYPPDSGGHAERVPKILSFDMDRYEGEDQETLKNFRN